MTEGYKPRSTPASGVSMAQLWDNASESRKTPKYTVKQRTLRVYNQGLEVTANTANVRTGEAYGLRSLGVQRDPYMREAGKPGEFSQYLFGRKEDTYRKAA